MDYTAALVAYTWLHPFRTAACVLLLAALSVPVYLLTCCFIRPLVSSLRDLPGPHNDHPVYGNLARIFGGAPGEAHIAWQEAHGDAVRFQAFFGKQRLLLFDPAALNHVLVTHAYEYPRPEEARSALAMILGKGVLFVDGDDHRRHRRVMNPAFAPAHMRNLVPVFFKHANYLRDILGDLVRTGAPDGSAWKDEAQRVAYEAEKKEGTEETVQDVMKWMNRVTLDIIGEAGFGYEFNSLSLQHNAFGRVFSSMFSPRASAIKPGPRAVLTQRFIAGVMRFVPIMSLADWIPNASMRQFRDAFKFVETESMKILQAKKSEVEKDGLDSVAGSKDLIALLLKSVQSEGKASMNDQELRGQLTTMLIAGHETTSTALTWTLWMLAKAPAVQAKLRREIREAGAQAKSEGVDEDLESRVLDSLPYLDAVTRECIRLEPPVTSTIRQAAHDDFIPLSKPVPSASDPSRTISSIRVKRGQFVFVPIRAVGLSKDVFGDDAEEFRPERWIESEDGSGKKIEGGVGLTGSNLSFLAGPMGCIGYKFAILEFKAILSVLIDEFDFALRDEHMQVEGRAVMITRPLLVGEEHRGNRLPLRIRLAPRDEGDGSGAH
ncbi:putative cytochrome P450 [Rhodotorula diobovata]|uniref:Putative cytochrome P450 n=1 Tax=Rhodotorula diobovata TaxID=5288 RepID=A0A5C5FWJ6_9BASI|nr:putative cytochrome P450 [Rhodotorula diobovata]